MKIKIDEISVKIKITEKGKQKAIITLDFGDFVLKGFRVSESNFENSRGEKLWLTPPSYLGGGRWHPMFFMPDKALWLELEGKIWDEYKNQQDEHFRKRFDLGGPG